MAMHPNQEDHGRAVPTRKHRGQDERTWRAVLALSLGGFAIGTAEFASMGLLPYIASGMHVSEPRAGHVISAYALGVVVGAPMIAATMARVSRKLLLIGLMAMVSLGNLAATFAPTYEALVVARFVAGLPHGAYFGAATLAAARMMGPQRRAKAAALVMSGLTVATVLGVPAASWLGQTLGWRTAFALVVILSVITVATLLMYVPTTVSGALTSPLTELGALRRPQVWLTLGIGMIGISGVFAVYTYVSTTMTDVAGMPRSLVPLALFVFGVGGVVGNLVGGKLADVSVVRALYIALSGMMLSLLLFVLLAHHAATALLGLFLIAATGMAGLPTLQTRLMDVAHDAQTAAAALNHSAINVGNALGAWLGGVAIAAGFGYTSPAVVGAILAAAGVVVLTSSVMLQRHTERRQMANP